MLILCIMILLAGGGAWWLLGVEAGVDKTAHVEPLFVLTPPQSPNEMLAQAAGNLSVSMPIRDASLQQTAVAAPTFILPGNGAPASDPITPMPEQPIVLPTQPAKKKSSKRAAKAKPVLPMFNGRPIRPVRTIHMLVTAYSPDQRSCGKFADNITASGYSVWTNGMKLVAADRHVLPFGAILTVPGYNGGRPVPVLDRGGKIKGNHIDLLFPTHEIARRWGDQHLDIVVWEYAD